MSASYFKAMNISKLLTLGAGLTLFCGGCAPNAIMFHETSKVGFNTQYQPDSSQPVNVTLGYKRRIVAVVPSRDAEKRDTYEIVTFEDKVTKQKMEVFRPKGEALSMVSRFDVVAKPNEGVAITNYFATGFAARVLTGENTDQETAKGVKALLAAPASLNAVDANIQSRRKALMLKLGGLDETKAQRWLSEAGMQKQPHKTATDTLQDSIARAESKATLAEIEAAYSRSSN